MFYSYYLTYADADTSHPPLPTHPHTREDEEEER